MRLKSSFRAVRGAKLCEAFRWKSKFLVCRTVLWYTWDMLRPGGAVVPDPQPPQPPAGQQEQQGDNRQQPVPAGPPVQKVLEGPVLDQGQGHQEVSTSSTGFPYTPKGYLPYSPGAVGEDVHDLQALGGEVAEGGVDQEQPKNTAAPQRIIRTSTSAFAAVHSNRPGADRPEGASQWPAGPGRAWWASCPGRGAGRGGFGAGPGCGRTVPGPAPGRSCPAPGEALRQGGGHEDHREAQCELGTGCSPGWSTLR